MICASIGSGRNLEQILCVLDDPYVEMAEIRLDLCSLSDSDIETLFSGSEKVLIATDRGAADIGRLAIAARSGARYIDLDVTVPAEMSLSVRKLCEQTGTSLIRSWHNTESTPDRSYLCEIAQRCVRYGADIVKVATACHSPEDARRLRDLYSYDKLGGRRLVAFGLGEEWSGTRIECLALGAPFSYACIDGKEATAPGQLTVERMHEAVYADSASFFRTGLELPCSKSIAQRAIIAAALAPGESRFTGYTPCGDSQAAIAVAKTLGAKVVRRADRLSVTGASTPLCPSSVNVGESGLLARLLIPVLSRMGGDTIRIEGRGTLPQRPLTGAAQTMAAFGVILRNAEAQDDREVHVPLTAKGCIYPGTAEVSGNGGSQLISGLLMALPGCGAPSQLYVAEPKSIPYMFITMDIMRKFGVKASVELEGDAEALSKGDWSSCTGASFSIKGRQRYRPAAFALEKDWSAAAPFLTAGAIFGKAEVEGLDTGSLQADISILDLLVEAGAGVSYQDDLVTSCKGPLRAFSFDLTNAPDLFPCAAVLAAFCHGESEIFGTDRLHAKESDRLDAIRAMLSGLGVEFRTKGESLYVTGKSLATRRLTGRMLRGGEFSASGDHRIAMALKAASLGADSPVIITDKECVDKSFPGFFECWDI